MTREQERITELYDALVRLLDALDDKASDDDGWGGFSEKWLSDAYKHGRKVTAVVTGS